MNGLILLAIGLFVLWLLAQALGWMIGAALHLLWIGAVVLFVIWAVGKFRANV